MSKGIKKVLSLIVFFLFINAVNASIVTVKDDRNYVNLHTEKLIVKIQRKPWQLFIYDKDNKLITNESNIYPLQFGDYHVTNLESYKYIGDTVIVKRDPPLYHAEDEAVIKGEAIRFVCNTSRLETKMNIYITFKSPSVFSLFMSTTAGGRLKTKEVFDSSPSEHFYGCGEPWNGSLDQKGQMVVMNLDRRNLVACWNQNCYVPFYISNKGYGIFVDEYTFGELDFYTDQNSVNISFFSPLYRPNSSMLYYFIYGPDLKDVITGYTDITGKSPLPPPWVFSNRVYPKEISESLVREQSKFYRENKIPMGVFIFESFASGHSLRPPPFEFNDRFKDGDKLVEDLNDMGYQTAFYSSDLYFGKGAGGFKGSWQKYGIHDYRNSEDVKKIKELLVDWCERRPGYKRGISDLDECNDYPRITPSDEYHNWVPYFYHQAFYEALDEIWEGDFFIHCRAGCARSQRYAMSKWPGDNYADFVSLYHCITSSLNIGISGFSNYCTELAGYGEANRTDELFARWAQWAAFCPQIVQVTRTRVPFSNRSDWAVDIYRKYIQLHTDLYPYIYTYAHIAHNTGIPIMRALVLDYKDDPNVYKLDTEYLFGDNILVAPVVSYNTTKDIYLPEGDWVDWWDGTIYSGPKMLKSYLAPIEKLPLFVKEGAIIPMAPTGMQYVGEFPIDPMTLKIYPSGKSSFRVYGDTITYPYNTKPYTNLKNNIYECIETEDKIEIYIGKSDISYILEVHNDKSPLSVDSNSKKMKNLTNDEEFNKASEGWWYDEKKGGIIWIKISKKLDTSHKIVINKSS